MLFVNEIQFAISPIAVQVARLKPVQCMGCTSNFLYLSTCLAVSKVSSPVKNMSLLTAQLSAHSLNHGSLLYMKYIHVQTCPCSIMCGRVKDNFPCSLRIHSVGSLGLQTYAPKRVKMNEYKHVNMVLDQSEVQSQISTLLLPHSPLCLYQPLHSLSQGQPDLHELQ